jgi:hypothetical protein
MVSRRRFLALGPVLAATAAAGPKSIVKDVLPQASAAAAAARVTLTRSTFAPHVHGTFVAHLEALRPIELKLTAVQDLPGTARATFPDREGQFSLLFRGPRQPALDQGTYRVEHPAIGAFALFLVPVGESADARHYEAIFNRIAAPAAREA